MSMITRLGELNDVKYWRIWCIKDLYNDVEWNAIWDIANGFYNVKLYGGLKTSKPTQKEVCFDDAPDAEHHVVMELTTKFCCPALDELDMFSSQEAAPPDDIMKGLYTLLPRRIYCYSHALWKRYDNGKHYETENREVRITGPDNTLWDELDPMEIVDTLYKSNKWEEVKQGDFLHDVVPDEDVLKQVLSKKFYEYKANYDLKTE